MADKHTAGQERRGGVPWEASYSPFGPAEKGARERLIILLLDRKWRATVTQKRIKYLGFIALPKRRRR